MSDNVQPIDAVIDRVIEALPEEMDGDDLSFLLSEIILHYVNNSVDVMFLIGNLLEFCAAGHEELPLDSGETEARIQ